MSWRFALRELYQRRGRSLLSLFSVAVAVASIVAVGSAASSTRAAYQRVFKALAGRADLEIVARGGGAFEEQFADDVSHLSGVRAVVPVFHRGTLLIARGKRARVVAIGIDLNKPDSMSGFKVSEGRLPTGENEVLLDESFAAGLDFKVGDEVKLQRGLGFQTFQVSGLTKVEDASRLQEGGTLFAPVDQLQQLFRAPGQVDALHLFIDKPEIAQTVIAEATAALPKELVVRTPAARTGLAEETLLLTEISLYLGSALSFITAVFIALSVFLMNISERRRQFSILRAIGATQGQIIGMVNREAIVLGLAAMALGVPAGIAAGRVLTRSMASMLEVTLPDGANLGWPTILGGMFGPIICLLGAGYPAYKASKVSPLEGMRPMITVHAQRGHRLTTVTGIVGLIVTLVLAGVCIQGNVPASMAVVAANVALVSLALFLPIALVPAIKAVGWPLRRLMNLEAEVSERLVIRHAGRSSLTIAVLFIAFASVVGLSNAVFSVTQDIRTWYESTITADFLLRTMMPDMNGQSATTMPETLRQEITALDGVEKVDAVRFMQVEAAGLDAIMVVREFGVYDRLPMQLVSGDPEEMLGRLARNETVIGSVLAERSKLRVGDTLEVILGSQKHSFVIAGVANEYSFGGSVLYLDRRVAESQFKVQGVDAFLIKVRADKSQGVEEKLKSLAETHGLLLQSFAELLRLIDSMVNGVVGGLWAVLALILLVGAMGVINTLTLNVLEQTRELGMLQAIGMQRRQIVHMVLAQAAYMGSIGILAGCVAGLVVAAVTNLCLQSLFGHHVQFALRPISVLLLLIVTLAVVMLAALFPAVRASRLNPIQAIRQP
jgi:putative ABC transport system permease protein